MNVSFTVGEANLLRRVVAISYTDSYPEKDEVPEEQYIREMLDRIIGKLDAAVESLERKRKGRKAIGRSRMQVVIDRHYKGA